MKSKIRLGILVFIIILFGYCITSNAAISVESKEVNSEEQFSIKVTSDVPLISYTISVGNHSGLTFVSSSGGAGEGTKTISNALMTGNTTEMATFTFKAPKVEKDTQYTITFSASGMGKDDANYSKVPDDTKTVTIKVKAPNQTPPETNTGTTGDTNNNNTPTTTEPAKSSEARLSNLGIRPNDFTGFKKDKYEYSTEVPNSVSEVEIYAHIIKDSKATVDGTGKVSLKEGNNTFEVKVTAEDGKTTKTYKLTIRRRTAEEDAKESSEARLSNLGIKPDEYDFDGFEEDKTEYTAEVPNEVKEIEVYAKALDPKAQITGTGMIELKEGENTINVEVIAQDGTKKAYTIKVTRKAAEATEEPDETVEDEEKFGLSTLTIAGLTLSPKFDVGTYEYTIDLKEDLTTLEIAAKATNKSATVEIIGNENLQPGENTITILVQNEDTEENATYQIIVNKNVEQETVRASWLKPSTWGKEEIIKIAMVVVIIILIVIAVILKIQIAKDNKNEKKVDLPGGDALDKALAEHQELTGEETEEVAGGNEESTNNENYMEEIAMNSATQIQEEEITTNEFNEEQQESFAVSEVTKGEVKRFLQEFPQEESYEANDNVENSEERRVTVDDLFNNDDFENRPRRRGRGKHF